MAEFDSYEDALNSVGREISECANLPPDLRDALLQRAAEFVERHQSGGPGWGSTEERPSSRSAGLAITTPASAFTGGRRTYFVVRNDHLKMFGTVASSAQAILTYVTASAPNVVTLSAALLVGVVTFGAGLLRKGVALEEDDYRILMLLKQFGPQSTDALSAMLNGIRVDGPGSLSADDVRKRLERLKTLKTPDGKYDSLVVLTDGRWDQNGL